MKKWIIVSVISILALSVLGFIGWRLQTGRAEKPVRTVTATRQTVTKDISFTGAVESEQSANISFELSGVIKDMYVSVGDTVTKGQKVALLDPQSVELELAKSHADTASTTTTALLNWQKADTTAKNTVTDNAKSLEQSRQAVRDAKTALDQSKELFAKKSEESGSESSITIAAYSTVLANEAAYSSAKAALATAIQTSTTSNTAAKNTADIAYAEYISTVQASRGDTGLSSLRAIESLARVKATKSIIRSPFNGVVTAKHKNIGELATIGNTVITIETIDSLQITAAVPETDAFALTEGMHASVTFDAVPNETLNATLGQIYPAATPLDGIPTFRVVLHQESSVIPLRSGITANITVHAAKEENVIAIPRRSIITKSEKQFVRKQTDDQSIEEIEITTGLTGSDGLVEITSGLSEGDKVVTQ